MSVRFGWKYQYFVEILYFGQKVQGFYILDKRYKDGIQWHDVPCFFRSAIICEVKTLFFLVLSFVLVLSSVRWELSFHLSHGLKIAVLRCSDFPRRTRMFWLFPTVCFKMCCRTRMFRWQEWRGKGGWMSAAPPHHNQFEQISSWSNINRYPSNTNIIG